MSEVIASSSEDLFWFHLAAHASPYATLGNAVLSVVPLGADAAASEAEILRKLDELKLQFDALRASIAQQITDDRVLARTGKVLALKELLDEYGTTRREQTLLDVQTASAIEKRSIMELLDSAATPTAYFHVYNTLLCMLVAIRITCFVLLKLEKTRLHSEVCNEIHDAVKYEQRGIDVAHEIGRNRVSGVNERLFLVDELGPVWGTTFTIKVDGKVVYSDQFAGSREFPRRNISDVRSQAQRIREQLADQYAKMVAQDVQRYYDTAHAIEPLVCPRTGT